MKFPILMGLFRAAEEQGVDLSDVDVPVDATAAPAPAPAPATVPTSELADLTRRLDELAAENKRLAKGWSAAVGAFDDEAKSYADGLRGTLGPVACDALHDLVLQARIDDRADDAGRLGKLKAFVAALPKGDLTGEAVAGSERIVPPAGDAADAEAKEIEALAATAKDAIAEANKRIAGA